jgi:hypothetical protein
MEKRQLAEQLASLTASLRPSRDASAEDLRTVRDLLAHQLVREEPELEEGTEASLEASLAEVGLLALDEVEYLELDEAAASALTALETEEPAAVEAGRVSRRNVPFLTSTHAGSVPSWAAGRRIDRTVGPFVDHLGRSTWFDIYLPVNQVAVVRTASSQPILQLPLTGFVITSDTLYSIPAGSVWILSKLLAATAPSGGYTGLRIKGGTLKLTSPPSVSGNKLVIGPSVAMTLELQLDQPEPQPPSNDLGGDARESKCQVPAKVVFEFTATGCQLVEASAASMVAYRNGVEFTHASDAAVYEPLLNRIVFPFDVRQIVVRIAHSESDVFSPRGRAIVMGGGWALPVAVAQPDSLGEAAGAGAMVVRLDARLGATWPGLDGGNIRLGETLLMTETDRLVLVTAQAANPGVGHRLLLWKDDPATGPSSVTLEFATPSELRFISLAGTVDALLVRAGLEAGVDRPRQASGERIALRATGAQVAFWQNANGTGVAMLTALAGLTLPAEAEPFAMALTNALLRVWPPHGLLLHGAMLDPNSVHTGFLAVIFALDGLRPFLRDPYVTNLPVLRRGRSRPEAAIGRVLALINWKAHADPHLSMLLLPGAAGAGVPQGAFLTQLLAAAPSTESGGSGAAHGSGGYAASTGEATHVAWRRSGERDPVEIAAKDAEAGAALRAEFEETAGTAPEWFRLLDVSTNLDQFGVGCGLSARQEHVTGGPMPIQIRGLDLVAAGRNVRVLMLPLFQWEPVVTVQNPDVGIFPSPVASASDGGPSVIGANSVTLVPIAPDEVMDLIVVEFSQEPGSVPAAALFTLPFGMKAAARFEPRAAGGEYWATLDLNRPKTADSRYTGGLQLSARAFRQTAGTDVESPSFPGATYQTRNLIDPQTLVPLGISVLSATPANPGVEAFFNQEMWPSGHHKANPRVPVTRIDFAGYGGSMFSDWANPQALAQISQVRFDAMVGRTAHEVVQVTSVLYPWAVPVVRTVTFQRRKEGIVIRRDSGWVAAGPGLYRYPQPDWSTPTQPDGTTPTQPATWSEIETHPGVVRGVYDVRRIRETGRVISRTFSGDANAGDIEVELLEVRFDGDFDIESVESGQGSGGRVTGCDHIGFVQRSPGGYPLVPEHLAAILEDEGAVGGPLDCWIDIGNSGQKMHIARVDVDTAPPALYGAPHFGAAARGSLSLPGDGAWSVLRHDLSMDEPQSVHPDTGVPLVRKGTAKGLGISNWYRIAEPGDLLRANSPNVDFGLVQSSAGHQAMFPRPRIEKDQTTISSTQRPLLADAYALSGAAGVFPRPSACFVGPVAYKLDIGPQGRYTLGPTTTMAFQVPPAIADRALVDTSAFAIHTRYAGPVRYTLDPAQPTVWSVEIDEITTAMDLGPFDELMGIKHHFRVGDGQLPALIKPEMVYADALRAVVDILTVLTELLGVEQVIDVLASFGSFKFKATLNLPIEDPNTADGYLDLGGMKIKGKLQVGISNSPEWNGFMQIGLGAQVPVLPPIMGGGEISTKLKGSELTEQEVTIVTKWGATVGKSLGPISVSGSFYFGIQVVVGTGGSWQIGLLVGVAGSADIWIVKITVRLELMAAIRRLGPPSAKVEALGQAKFAAEVTVCWFLTISVSYTLQYSEMLDI